jgi:hypothetical protein
MRAASVGRLQQQQGWWDERRHLVSFLVLLSGCTLHCWRLVVSAAHPAALAEGAVCSARLGLHRRAVRHWMWTYCIHEVVAKARSCNSVIIPARLQGRQQQRVRLQGRQQRRTRLLGSTQVAAAACEAAGQAAAACGATSAPSGS